MYTQPNDADLRDYSEEDYLYDDEVGRPYEFGERIIDDPDMDDLAADDSLSDDTYTSAQDMPTSQAASSDEFGETLADSDTMSDQLEDPELSANAEADYDESDRTGQI